MNVTRTFAFGITAFAAAGSLGTSARAAAFSNGSFESPALPAGVYLQSNGSAIGPWTLDLPPLTAAEFIHGTHVNLAPYDGAQFVTFNGYDTPAGASIYQDFDTVASTTYTVTCAVGRLGAAGGPLSLDAAALNGSSVLTLASLSAPSAAGTWMTHSFTFTATGPTTRLRFTDTSLSTIGIDVALDGVTVVPAPGTAVVLGLAGVLAARRRRGGTSVD